LGEDPRAGRRGVGSDAVDGRRRCVCSTEAARRIAAILFALQRQKGRKREKRI